MSQQAFADQIGYTQRQVVAWETAVSAPPIWAVFAVRRLCGVDPEWVFSGPGTVPLRDAVPPESDRLPRLKREVARMANDAGLTLPDRAIANVAQLIARETPEAEPEAKRQAGKMLRALSTGKSPA